MANRALDALRSERRADTAFARRQIERDQRPMGAASNTAWPRSPGPWQPPQPATADARCSPRASVALSLADRERLGRYDVRSTKPRLAHRVDRGAGDDEHENETADTISDSLQPRGHLGIPLCDGMMRRVYRLSRRTAIALLVACVGTGSGAVIPSEVEESRSSRREPFAPGRQQFLDSLARSEVRQPSQTIRWHHLSDVCVGSSSPTQIRPNDAHLFAKQTRRVGRGARPDRDRERRRQAERRTLSGDRVAIYNLAGKVRVQAGQRIAGRRRRHARRARRRAAQARDRRRARLGIASRDLSRPIASSIRRWAIASRTQMQRQQRRHVRRRRQRSRIASSRDRVEIRDSGSGLDAHADLVVSVPRGQRIAIHWGVGEANVSNVDGDLLVSVASATVTAEHTRGRLNLDTGSGSVSLTDAQGDVTLDTGSGARHRVRRDRRVAEHGHGSGSIRASDIDVKTLKADVGSGGMRLARVKAPRIDVDAGSGGIDLDILSAIDDLRIDAGSGPVTLRLPADAERRRRHRDEQRRHRQ